MRRGATDYILKDRLGRLGTAVRNALEKIRLLRETRRTAEALRESEELFVKAFKLSPDAVLIVRIADRVILRVNAAVCRLFGVSEEKLLGRPTDEFVRWSRPKERNELIETVL